MRKWNELYTYLENFLATDTEGNGIVIVLTSRQTKASLSLSLSNKLIRRNGLQHSREMKVLVMGDAGWYGMCSSWPTGVGIFLII